MHVVKIQEQSFFYILFLGSLGTYIHKSVPFHKPTLGE